MSRSEKSKEIPEAGTRQEKVQIRLLKNPYF